MAADKDADLPKMLVKRIVKSKLSQASGDDTIDYQVNKDALLAFAESAKVFVSYLSSTANEICKESRRQTISADDVFTALQDLDFGEFVGPLKEYLEAFRKQSKEKKGKKADVGKKRKAAAAGDEDAPPSQQRAVSSAQPPPHTIPAQPIAGQGVLPFGAMHSTATTALASSGPLGGPQQLPHLPQLPQLPPLPAGAAPGLWGQLAPALAAGLNQPSGQGGQGQAVVQQHALAQLKAQQQQQRGQGQ